MSEYLMTVATDDDAFVDMPQLESGLRQERATWALALSDEDFAAFVAAEAQAQRDEMNEQLWIREGC